MPLANYADVCIAVHLTAQVASYSEVSIRELIKWVQYLLIGCSNDNSRSDSSSGLMADPNTTASSSAAAGSHGAATATTPSVTLAAVNSSSTPERAPAVVPEQVLSDTAWAVYAARFRTSAARAVVQQLLTGAMGWPMPNTAAGGLSPHNIDGAGRGLQVGSLSLQWQPPQEQSQAAGTDLAAGHAAAAVLQGSPSDVAVAFAAAAVSAHDDVLQCVLASEFIRQHGVYMVQPSWLEGWLQLVQQHGMHDMQQAGWLGVYLYSRRFRHAAARVAVAAAVAARFGLELQPGMAATVAASGQPAGPLQASFASSSGSCQWQSVLPDMQLPAVEPDKPFVVTPRFLQAWQVAGRSLQAGQPLLVIGLDGCGKSESLRVLSWLLGMRLENLNMTPETEPAALVGQFVPASTPGHGDPVVWVDGAVTKAYKAGAWLCLDGLAEAEAAVLERLNPLLESPAFWVPSEQGCTEPLPHKNSFRFMATMTPPSKGRGGGAVGVLASELSPAMYNRLSLVVLEDVLEAGEDAFRGELQELAAALCVDGERDSQAARSIAEACCCIRAWEGQQSSRGSLGSLVPLTLRNYVRLMDMAYRIQQEVGLQLPQSFLAAFDLSLAGQLSAASAEAVLQLRKSLGQLLQVRVHSWTMYQGLYQGLVADAL